MLRSPFLALDMSSRSLSGLGAAAGASAEGGFTFDDVAYDICYVISFNTMTYNTSI